MLPRRAAWSGGPRAAASTMVAALGLLLALFSCLSCLGLASAQSSSTLLEDGEPLQGYVPAGQSLAYFKIQIPSPWPTMPIEAEAITINVTPIGDGNPDRQCEQPQRTARRRPEVQCKRRIAVCHAVVRHAARFDDTWATHGRRAVRVPVALEWSPRGMRR